MAELQVIPARHGTATFVPAGQIIKIINSSGSQVIDTWAFALPKPDPKPDTKKGNPAQKQDDGGQPGKEESKQDTPQQTASKPKTKGINLPSQEEAESATKQAMKSGEETATAASQQKSSWSSYVPTTIWPSGKKDSSKNVQQETEQQKDSKTWASYFPSGKGFSNYIPQAATDTASAFAASHKRDPSKTYMEQLQDLSKTPVGAAGMAALTGSGWTGSTWAGYQAWNVQNAANAAPMEFMSMPHTRAATLHMRPKVNDTFLSNLREPILTLIEDTAGIHDTLIAACDPARYKGLGVENWEEHGSCAENLVLALKELNERAGLKGAKAVGSEVTINTVPAPLNLFMNIPWDESGDLGFHPPKSKKDDYVRLKAERDVVVVMSACPQDILEINNKMPTDAQFIVEGEDEPLPAVKRTQVRRRPPPRKISSSHATSTVGTEAGAPSASTAPAQRKPVPQKRRTAAAPANPTPAQAQTPQSQPVRKKPVPPPVAPMKKSETSSTSTPNAGATNTAKTGAASVAKTGSTNAGTASAGDTSATATPVAQKKKPRKLNAKAAPAAS